MLNKRTILDACMAQQQKKIERLTGSLRVVRENVANAPASMVSWSDTMKFQQGQIADKLAENLRGDITVLDRLRTLSDSIFSEITLGAVFTLQDNSTGELNHYLLIRQGGGGSFRVGDSEISSISARAPLSKVVMGKRRGDRVVFGNKEFYIVEIQ